MNQIVLNRLDQLEVLCKKHRVKYLYAFGSVCSEHFHDSSDIDFLVSFKPMDFGDYADNYFSLANALEELFNRPVDLITDKSLSNPYFIRSLNQNKFLIYGRPDKEILV